MRNVFLPLFAAAFTAPLAVQAAPAKAPVKSSPVKIALPSLAGWNYSFDEDELESAWTWTSAINATGPFETRVVLHRKDAKNYLMLRVVGNGKTATLRFWRVVDGQLEKLGEPDATIPASPKLNGQLAIQRSSSRVRALWNGRVVVSAWSGWAEGEFGSATRGAVKLSESRMQPTAEVVFSDDFMRAQGPDEKETSGEWRGVTGVWKTSGLLGPRADAALNPNPFVFRAEVPATSTSRNAVATAGKWFWSDYAITASVRPTLKNLNAPLVAGLAAYVQSDGSSIVGEVDFRSGRATIRRGNTILVTGAPFVAEPNQWHRLYFEPGPGTIRLLVDGVERARVNTSALKNQRDLAQGPAALTSTVSGANHVDFDDVRIATNEAISDDFQVAAVGRWDDVQGAWQTRQDAKGNGRRVKISAGPAVTLTGNPEREEGLVEAHFSVPGTSNVRPSLGVVFAARDAKNFYTARFRGTQLELVEFANAKGRILGSAKVLSLPSTPWLSVEWREGVITARGAGTVATATVSEVPAGRVGAWSDAPANGVALTSFRALGAAPGFGEPPLPARFTKDRLMKNWASNAAAWQRKGDTWWNTGDFFRDAAITLPLPPLPAGGTLTLLLNADPATRNSGSRLEIARNGDNWNFKLWDGTRAIRAATVANSAWKETTKTVRFVRRPLDAGRVALRVAAGNRALLSEVTTTSGSGSAFAKVGVRTAGFGAKSNENWRKFGVKIASQEREKRAFVGVQLSPLLEEMQRDMKLSDMQGVLVAEVEPNSPAAGAGLQSNDLIRAIDGKPVKAVEDVVEAVSNKPVGGTFDFQVWRQTGDASGVDWEQTRASTSQMLDYTFTSAPVDWQATQGRWEVAERWTCSQQWAFFAGTNAVNPTLWSRFRTRGDWTLEAYLATPMDFTRGERSPIDINLTVDGDGRNLASGYSFLFGANGRTTNRIYRGDEVAWEKPFQAPQGAGNTHQDWFYVRLERRTTPQGLRFRYSVNGKEIANYIDPQPLDTALSNGGRLAFWTYNGGLSVARARLWYNDIEVANEAGKTLAPSTLTASRVTTVQKVSLPNPLGEWDTRRDNLMSNSAQLKSVKDGNRNALQVTNPNSGGDWTTYITQRPFDAARYPTLRFDYRIPVGVRVNLYAKVENRWREIVFTGDAAQMPRGRRGTRMPLRRPNVRPFAGRAERPAILPGNVIPSPPVDNSMTIGRVANVVVDNAWHTAQIDLLGVLRAANLPTEVQALALAAPDREYLRCGIGGNHLGATYWISNLQTPSNQAPQSVASAR
jgi:hypothetical protein